MGYVSVIAMATARAGDGYFLGNGAFGSVFHDKSNNTAIKKINRHHQDAEKEVRIMIKCQHQYVIKLIKHYYEGRTLCIVMEFADYGTLKTFISEAPADSKHFKEYSIWRKMWHIASALDYMHSMSPVTILHRDLKPDNVLGVSLMGGAGGEKVRHISWKLADFGI